MCKKCLVGLVSLLNEIGVVSVVSIVAGLEINFFVREPAGD